MAKPNTLASVDLVASVHASQDIKPESAMALARLILIASNQEYRRQCREAPLLVAEIEHLRRVTDQAGATRDE